MNFYKSKQFGIIESTVHFPKYTSALSPFSYSILVPAFCSFVTAILDTYSPGLIPQAR